GCVNITYNFPGCKLNTEYLFSLFTNLNSVSLLNLLISYEITKFTANNYIAAATIIIIFNSSLFKIIVPVIINTF
ncbi:hypothetical protein BGZ61DRAFT_319832, partial [Ilyonectria robusta]|uniref:uncharacterized protein n=1 Tax=Ilyonectria robusta TaxID=1079257 RepID=UPI001E8EF2E3